MRTLRAAYPTASFTIWGTDEARLGLKPIVRRIWAPRGQRPRAVQRQGYAWTYLFGFVEPATGRLVFRLFPCFTRDTFALALREFAHELRLGPQRRAVLVLDRAGAHQHVDVPEGLHLVYQPAHSPELQPAERLWPLIREALANRLFQTLDAIEDAIVHRCRELYAQTALLQRITSFYWWIQAMNAAL